MLGRGDQWIKLVSNAQLIRQVHLAGAQHFLHCASTNNLVHGSHTCQVKTPLHLKVTQAQPLSVNGMWAINSCSAAMIRRTSSAADTDHSLDGGQNGAISIPATSRGSLQADVIKLSANEITSCSCLQHAPAMLAHSPI